MPPRTITDKINEIAKRRGFYWPSFEIYGGLSGFYTYGDLGAKLKRNIENLWREYFVRRQGFLELEAPIINPKKVFEASGHLENFKEYTTRCISCGESFRADHLIEDKTGLVNVEAMGGESITALMTDHKIKCPNCGGKLTEPSLILTMFKTMIGATGNETGYARPETAQAMFLNFRRGFQHAREKLPFALAQSSKVMRNEISPRRGLLRVREFTIMELELFFDPEEPECPWLSEVENEIISLYTEDMLENGVENSLNIPVHDAIQKGYIINEWQGYFMGTSQIFLKALGIPVNKQRFRAHLPNERAHYSLQTYDHEVQLESIGWFEVLGCAYRTDYDLKSHQEASGIDLTALRVDGTRVIPHVVEPSYGLDRLVYAVLENSYERRKKRNIMHLPRTISPFQVAVFPLVSKDGLPEKAEDIRQSLVNKGFWVYYDESGSIGRRYARSDEIGTPLAVVIDYDTMEKDVLTIRDRDTWDQVSLSVDKLSEMIGDYFKEIKNFEDLGEKIVRE